MLVRATQRGQFEGRIYNAGEVFDCPADEVELIILGPNGMHLGWVEPVQWAPLSHKRVDGPLDGSRFVVQAHESIKCPCCGDVIEEVVLVEMDGEAVRRAHRSGMPDLADVEIGQKLQLRRQYLREVRQ